MSVKPLRLSADSVIWDESEPFEPLDPAMCGTFKKWLNLDDWITETQEIILWSPNTGAEVPLKHRQLLDQHYFVGSAIDGKGRQRPVVVSYRP